MKKFHYVSHRARGFASSEQTGEAFRNAFSAGITKIEFDIRLTSDGVPVVHHDSSLKRVFGNTGKIACSTLASLQQAAGKSGNLNNLLTLEEVFGLLNESVKATYTLFIDIKDAGGESLILEIAGRYGLLDNIVVVSWLPEVLYALHRINPSIPLCFSHHYIPQTAGRIILGTALKLKAAMGLSPYKKRDFFLLTERYNQNLSQSRKLLNPGEDYEHILTTPPQGELGNILRETGGFVCIHYSMITAQSYKKYTGSGFKIIPYSINTTEQFNALPGDALFPFVLTDNLAFALESIKY